jgi:hypothetical protein
MSKRNESDQKQKFLHNEFLTSSLNASMQHSPTYRKKADDEATSAFDKKRQDFRKSFRDELERIANNYKVPVDNHTHVTNISELAEVLTKLHKHILDNGKFRIGPAQKALNLYLKYLWCAGEIIEPPHCPIDNGVIEKLGADFAGCLWTRLDDIEIYKAMIAEARKKNNSLAKWELRLWNDGNIKD